MEAAASSVSMFYIGCRCLIPLGIKPCQNVENTPTRGWIRYAKYYKQWEWQDIKKIKKHVDKHIQTWYNIDSQKGRTLIIEYLTYQ